MAIKTRSLGSIKITKYQTNSERIAESQTRVTKAGNIRIQSSGARDRRHGKQCLSSVINDSSTEFYYLIVARRLQGTDKESLSCSPCRTKITEQNIKSILC